MLPRLLIRFDTLATYPPEKGHFYTFRPSGRPEMGAVSSPGEVGCQPRTGPGCRRSVVQGDRLVVAGIGA